MSSPTPADVACLARRVLSSEEHAAMRRWLKRPAGLGALAILLPPDGRRAGGLDFERLALAERFG